MKHLIKITVVVALAVGIHLGVTQVAKAGCYRPGNNQFCTQAQQSPSDPCITHHGNNPPTGPRDDHAVSAIYNGPGFLLCGQTKNTHQQCGSFYPATSMFGGCPLPPDEDDSGE